MEHDSLKITFPDGKTKDIQYGTSAGSLLKNYGAEKGKILAVLINNKLYPLDKELRYNAEIEPVYATSREGIVVYRRSLCLLLAASAHKLFPGSRLLVGHSLGSGYYYTLETGKEISGEQINALEKEMQNLVAQDKKIMSRFVSYEDALKLFEKSGLTETRRLMDFKCPPRVQINSIDDFSDLYFGPLVPSTGFLNVFSLMKYKEGFLLRFPKSTEPDVIPEFQDQPKLFEIYSRYKQWG
ncbi:MAG: nucleoside kinase, partial [Treponema porcinum]|nr:nucleoside kinase [Treponema porcinum]MDY5453109.1 nucleoside kinase [Treponema porcinum]